MHLQIFRQWKQVRLNDFYNFPIPVVFLLQNKRGGLSRGLNHNQLNLNLANESHGGRGHQPID